MNKKFITAIAIGLAAVIVIALAVFAIIKGIKPTNKPSQDGSSSQISSQVDTQEDTDTPSTQTGSGDSTSSGNSSEDKEEETNETESTVETVQGKIVEVPIIIKDNPGIVMGNFAVEYDTELFEYKGYKKGSIFKDYETAENKKGRINVLVYSNDNLWSDTDKNGTLITLKLKVKDDTKAGEYTVSVKEPDGKVMLINAAEKEVNATLFAKTIVVK